MESDVITLQDLFVAKAAGRGDDRHRRAARGCCSPLACTGLKPHFLEKMAANGVILPPTFFRAEAPAGRPTFAAAPYGGGQVKPAPRPLQSSAPSLPGVAAAAAPKIASLDTAGYPTVRVTVVTPKPVASRAEPDRERQRRSSASAPSTSAARRASCCSSTARSR